MFPLCLFGQTSCLASCGTQDSPSARPSSGLLPDPPPPLFKALKPLCRPHVATAELDHVNHERRLKINK